MTVEFNKLTPREKRFISRYRKASPNKRKIIKLFVSFYVSAFNKSK